MSRRGFAAHVGVSTTVIQRLVAARKIPLDEAGKMPVTAGLPAFLKWRKLESRAAGGREVEGAHDGGEKLAEDLRAAELAKKRWGAKWAELRYLRERGELVPMADVRADAIAASEKIR